MKRTDAWLVVLIAVLTVALGRHLVKLAHGRTRVAPAPAAAPASPGSVAPETPCVPAPVVEGQAFERTRTAVDEWSAGRTWSSEPVPETGSHVLWLE